MLIALLFVPSRASKVGRILLEQEIVLQQKGGLFVRSLHPWPFLPSCLSLASQRILASGSCQIDHAIEELEGAEAYDTAAIMVEFEGGKTAVIDVCRQAPYG